MVRPCKGKPSPAAENLSLASVWKERGLGCGDKASELNRAFAPRGVFFLAR
jgi:hypothetical protein